MLNAQDKLAAEFAEVDRLSKVRAEASNRLGDAVELLALAQHMKGRAERAFGIADTALDAAHKALPAEAKAELMPF